MKQEKVRRGTKSLKVYMQRTQADISLLLLLVRAGVFVDQYSEDSDFAAIYRVFKREGGLTAHAFRLFLSRAADGFEYYLASLLSEIFAKRPEMLKCSAQVTYEQLIELGSFEAFYSYAAEKRIMGYMYKGLPEVLTYLTTLGVRLKDCRKLVEQACETMELRHIIIHNDGRVNNTFKEKTRYKSLQCGKVFSIRKRHIEFAAEGLSHLAHVIDMKAVQHFGLKTAVLPKPLELPFLTKLKEPDDYLDGEPEIDPPSIGNEDWASIRRTHIGNASR